MNLREKLEKFMEENDISWEDVADYNAQIDTERDLLEEELEEAMEERKVIYQDYLEKGKDYMVDALFEDCEDYPEDESDHVLDCLLEHSQDRRPEPPDPEEKYYKGHATWLERNEGNDE